jgi:hypothetical protein
MEAKFKARVALLSAWQHTGETVTIDQNASYHEDKPFDPFFLIEKRP